MWGEGVTVCCFQTPEAGMSAFRKQQKNTSQGALEVTQILQSTQFGTCTWYKKYAVKTILILVHQVSPGP